MQTLFLDKATFWMTKFSPDAVPLNTLCVREGEGQGTRTLVRFIILANCPLEGGGMYCDRTGRKDRNVYKEFKLEKR